MNAALKPITARAVGRPSFLHWNLVQANEKDAWKTANWEAIRTRFRSYGEIVADDCTLGEYADVQWDMQRAHLEELRDDAKCDDPYVASEEE